MNKQEKYYWIKLKTNFFNQERIDFLLSQKNGAEYVVLYQMLILQTANNNGELSMKVGEMIVPYTIEKIVRDTKYFDVDTVAVALELYKQLGLVYQEQNGTLQIEDITSMVGSESASKEAVKKRIYREKQRELKLKEDNKGTNCPTEYRDRDRDRDKKIDINNIKELKIKKEYGEFKNVLLTDEELEKLKKGFNDYETKIETLSCYIESSGKKYKSHYATILNWSRKDEKPKVQNFRKININDKGDVVYE